VPNLPPNRRPHRVPDGPRPRFPTLHRAILTLTLLGVGSPGLACSPPAPPSSDFPAEPVSDAEPSPLEVAPDEGLRLMVSLGSLDYAPGEAVTARIVLTNQISEPRVLSFPSAQRFDLRLTDDAGAEVFLWSSEQMFAQFLGTEELAAADPDRAPGESTSEGASLRWEVEFVAPRAPGRYRLEAWIPATGLDLSTSVPLTVRTP